MRKHNCSGGLPFIENIRVCLVDPVKHLRRSWDGRGLVEEGCVGPLMFNSTDPCVHMAYPTCQRLELAASLDRKVQRPDKMGRKKAFGLGHYIQEVYVVLLGLKIHVSFKYI